MPDIFALFRSSVNEHRIPKIVISHVKRHKGMIFGRRALNKQVSLPFMSPTFDWDILIKNPKKHANRLQRKLDRKVGGGSDLFYTKPALHPGTTKVMHIGNDLKKNTKDDYAVVDVSAPSRKFKSKKIGGVRYQSLSSIKKGKKKTLQDPMSAFRHEKDRNDLRRIEAFERTKGDI